MAATTLTTPTTLSTADTPSAEAHVFVTVGTTQFDALADVVCTPSVLYALRDAFAPRPVRLTLQLGRGVLPSACARTEGEVTQPVSGVSMSWFRFAPDTGAYVSRAALVVCHAGAGSIFDALRAGRPALVVINDALADNHQVELGEAMAAEGYVVCTEVGGVARAVIAQRWRDLKPLPPSRIRRCIAAIDALWE